MAKRHSHKHSHKHSHSHIHSQRHEKRPDNGKSGEPQTKPVAPEPTGNPAGPDLSQWTSPIPDPHGGPFSWRTRLTPRGSYIPVVVLEYGTNGQSRSPGVWEWQILGSEVISLPRHHLSQEMQPYTTNLAQPLAPPYGSYDSRINMLQTMPMVAHPQYQHPAWAGPTKSAIPYYPNPQGTYKQPTANEPVQVDTNGTHKRENIAQEKVPDQKGSSSHKPRKLSRHNSGVERHERADGHHTKKTKKGQHRKMGAAEKVSEWLSTSSGDEG